jgi:hypothetical protein
VPLSSRLTTLLTFARRHQSVLWWAHSLWALVVGIGVMWIGSRHFGFVRVAVLYVAAIWLLTLGAPALVATADSAGPLAGRGEWLRLGVNYLTRNFYQQVLFFVLPIYYASATLESANMIFVVLLGVSALLSTLDRVYDHHLSTSRTLTALFFTLNLFACLNAALPVLWHLSPSAAIRASAALAFAGFASLQVGRAAPADRTPWVALIISAVLLGFVATRGQRGVPPVPMRLSGVSFGDDVQRDTLEVGTPFTTVPPRWSGTLDAVSAVRAPMGLTEVVRHQWLVNGALVRTTAVHELASGRRGGFRLWTALPLTRVDPGTTITLEVETAGGQLIGRRVIHVRY